VKAVEGRAEPDKDGGAGKKEFFERSDELAFDLHLDRVALVMSVARHAGRGKSAAKAFLQKALGFKRSQIAADGLVGDIEPLGEFGNRRGAVFAHRRQDGLTPVA